MLVRPLRALWAEPRVPDAPGPRRLDWALVGAAVLAGVIEAATRPELVWRPVSLLVVVGLAFTLPWRRTHSGLVAVLAFATTGTIDLVAITQGVEWEGLGSGIFLLLLLYAVTRWGSGREAAAGLAAIAVPLVLTAVDGAPVGDVVGGTTIVALAAALGAGVRYQRSAHHQELDAVRAREREQLARELHDTVAHHVSAIAVRAQAGRALAPTSPDAATDALLVIEEEASRTLEEMRTMVGALRHGSDADLAPQQGAADVERLASPDGVRPRVEVTLVGELHELVPSVDVAVYRLAREAVTNALRHARDATCVQVRVQADRHEVRLTVDDDGAPVASASRAPSGFGLVGMAERAEILGGSLQAGPRAGGGWSVEAVLSRHGSPS